MNAMRFERILKAILVVVAVIAAVVIFSANLSRGMTKLSLIVGTVVVCLAWAIVDVAGNHFRVRRIGAVASQLGLQQHDITDARIIHAPENKQTKFEPQLWVTGELEGAPIDAVDTLITDTEISDADRKALIAHGVEVVLA